MSLLNSLPAVKTKEKKRVGRGYGSGVGGHTATRGQKGQKARNSVPLWFEGGQLPIVKRLPFLRGKGRLNPLKGAEIVSLTLINKLSENEITVEVLRSHGLISRTAKAVKVLQGQIDRKVQLKGISVSANAKKAIEQAGGAVTE